MVAQYTNPNVFDAQTAYQQAQRALLGAQTGVTPFTQQRITAGRAVLGAQGGVIDARQQQLGAQGGVIDARQNQLGYQQGVLNARAALAGPAAAQLAARSGVVTAGNQVVGQQQNLLGLQQGDISQRQLEFGQQQAALNNTADQTATAQYERYQTARDRRLAMLGIAPRATVVQPVGAQSAGDIAPGVRAAGQSQAQEVQRANTVADTQRGFTLETAKNIVALAQTNEQAAQLAAQQAGITVDQANQAVTQAQLASDQAGLGVSSAQIGADRAGLGVSQAQIGSDRASLQEGYAANSEQQAGIGVSQARTASDYAQLAVSDATLQQRMQDNPPGPGYERWTDPYTGAQQWLLPAERDQKQLDYENQMAAYRTSISTGGSALAAAPAQLLLNAYTFYIPGQGPVDTSRQILGQDYTNNDIENELVRRLMAPPPLGQSMSRTQAEESARAQIQTEIQQREAAYNRANSAAGSITEANP